MTSGRFNLFELIQLVGGHGPKGVAGVFVVYLDDSDSTASSVVTLAGYLGTLEAWQRFEIATEGIWGRYGISVLHAKDFHNTKGEFAGWTRVKKRSFVNEVYAVVGANLGSGIGRSIRKASFKQRRSEAGPGHSRMSAYGAAFATIMYSTARGNSLAKYIEEEGISYVIESGHKNNAELEQYFHFAKTHEMYAGIARSITFVGKGDSHAIQLADFYAFHDRRFAAAIDRFDNKVALPGDPIYRLMRAHLPHYSMVITDPFGDVIEDWRAQREKG